MEKWDERYKKVIKTPKKKNVQANAKYKTVINKTNNKNE